MFYYRPHTEYDGKVMFLLCVFVSRSRSRSGGPQVKVQVKVRGPPGQGQGAPQVKVQVKVQGAPQVKVQVWGASHSQGLKRRGRGLYI